MLTANDMAKAFNDVGIDTPEKVQAVLGYLLSIVSATRAQAGVVVAQQKRIETDQAAAAEVDKASQDASIAAAAETAALENLVTLFQ